MLFQIFSIVSYCRILTRVPVLHSRSLCVSVNPKLLIYPFPTFPFGNHKFAFYVCGSISVLYISSFVSFFYIPHVSGMIRYLSFSVWLCSLRIFSGFTHLAVNGIILFFFYGNNLFLHLTISSSKVRPPALSHSCPPGTQRHSVNILGENKWAQGIWEEGFGGGDGARLKRNLYKLIQYT